MNKDKYFIALLPHSSFEKEISRIKASLFENYGLKQALHKKCHLTLQMPFILPNNKEKLLVDIVHQICTDMRPLLVPLGGFHRFSSNTYYIKVNPDELLYALYDQLRTDLKAHLGILQDHRRVRAFVPHFTVAYRDVKKKMIKDLDQYFLALDYCPQDTLMNSVAIFKKTNGGYEIFEEVKLSEEYQN